MKPVYLLAAVILIVSCKKSVENLPEPLKLKLMSMSSCSENQRSYFQQVEFRGQKNQYYLFSIENNLTTGLFPDLFYQADGTKIMYGTDLDTELRGQGKLRSQKWYCDQWR